MARDNNLGDHTLSQDAHHVHNPRARNGSACSQSVEAGIQAGAGAVEVPWRASGAPVRGRESGGLAFV